MIEIRELKSPADLKTVEQMQRLIWGSADIDILAPLSLRAAIETGALLLGVFDRTQMVGFSYGFPGFHKGQIEIHSDMTGLLPAYRDRGLGFRLKLAQRDWCLERGIRLVTWTFDPLRSRNGYFNFNKLGAISDSYRVNFYGEESTSFLHRNATDRLWITWELDSARVIERLGGGCAPAIEGEVVVAIGEGSAPIRSGMPLGGKAVIEVPLDPDAIEAANFEQARAWRLMTREAFLLLMKEGFVVTGSKGGWYQLERL